VSQALEDLLPTLAKLAAHRDERRSLADLAREAGTSASTFQRAFSRIVGESPKQYTRRLQLESAALELITTTRSVLDVALDAGFESHEGFTRVFATHFGVPPKEFRQRHAHLATDEINAALIDQIGPCIGLFRAPLDPMNQESTMNYDITRQNIEDSIFLYKTARCSHADVAKALGGIFGGVFQYAVTNGLELRSPPTTLYAEWGPGMVTIHAGLMIGSAPASVPDGMHVETLPACEAAIAIHTGPYDGLGDAHAAMDQFLAEHGLRKSGAAREVYLTDPGEVPDPKQWKTQIVWPIAT
jgi:AraC family transcriptional regulator